MEMKGIEKTENLQVNVEDPKEKEEGKAEPKMEAGKGKEEESDYRTLLSTPENIYETAILPAERKELYRRVRVYRALSLILLLLTLIFAAVVIALCLQLQARPACLKTEHDDGAAQHLCTLELCNQLHPRVEKAVVTSTEKKDSECQPLCSNGWLKFGDSCFFLSKLRNSWNGGRQQCQKWGADLAVIDNMQVQEFLTKKGNLMYWIGLNRSSGGQWMWVNQSALGQSYWGPHSDKDSCGFLIGKDMPTKSWGSSDCSYLSAYICQKKI